MKTKSEMQKDLMALMHAQPARPIFIGRSAYEFIANFIKPEKIPDFVLMNGMTPATKDAPHG